MVYQAILSLVSLAAVAQTGEAFSVQSGDTSATTNRRNFFNTVAGTAATVATVSTLFPTVSNADEHLVIGGKLQYGDESIMSPKAHGTSETPVQESLRYGVSNKLADKISNYNRHFAEFGGYFQSTTFEDDVRAAVTEGHPVTFYDSNSGKPLFVAPIGRTVDEFIEESKYHGWPSFRDQEVVWENVRVLKSSGETVSVDGTHLGHNLPSKDRRNRYCINLVCVAGNPV